MRTIRVCCVPLPGCLLSALTGPVDLLYAANAVAAATGVAVRFQWRFASPARGDVATATQLCVPTGPLPRRGNTHVVIVAGPSVTSAPDLERALLTLGPDTAKLRRWLERQRDAGAILAASCVGVFALAELGLLAGRRATTTWWLAESFAQRYPDVALDSAAMVVADGPVVTAGAAMAHLDLALHLISHFAGAEVARLSARYTVTDQRRTSQAMYAISTQLRAEDPLLKRASRRVARADGAQLTVAALAEELGVTARTLHRRFVAHLSITPQAYLARARIERAKALLESGGASLQRIADLVGFADVSALSKAFKRGTNTTPAAYRAAFNPAHGRAPTG